MEHNDYPNNPAPQPTEGQERAFGPLIGILIIIAVLIFGGLYFWGKYVEQRAMPAVPTDVPSSFEVIGTTVEDVATYTISDEAFEALIDEANEASLEDALGDLSDLDSLDSELDALEAELDF